MQKEVVASAKVPKPIGPYSPATILGDLVFVAGQGPLKPGTTELARGTIEEETERVLENIKAVLEAAGSSMDKVLKTTVFMADLNDFGRMNGVYAKYFPSNPPARSTVQVARLPMDIQVEIECIAHR